MVLFNRLIFEKNLKHILSLIHYQRLIVDLLFCGSWLIHYLRFCAAELMLLGFISLLLTASSRTISNICIDSKFYNSNFSPCSKSEVEGTTYVENVSPQGSKQLTGHALHHSFKRILSELNKKTCAEVFSGIYQNNSKYYLLQLKLFSSVCSYPFCAEIFLPQFTSW